jgi:hypothetical protein
VVRGWIWYSALDLRTCPGCWAKHGTFHESSETLESHPNCRCVMVPQTRPWEELGIGPSLQRELGPEADRVLQVESGEAIFAKLSPAERAEILGPAAGRAYEAGAVRLRDLLQESHSAIWGGSVGTRSLRSVLGEEEARRFLRGGGGGAPPAVARAGTAVERARAFAAENQILLDGSAEAVELEALVRSAGREVREEVERRIAAGRLASDARLAELRAESAKLAAELDYAAEKVKALRLLEKARPLQAVERRELAELGDFLNSSPAALRYSELSDELYRAVRARDSIAQAAVREVLVEIRPGLGRATLPVHAGARKAAVAKLDEAASWLPREWIEDTATWARETGWTGKDGIRRIKLSLQSRGRGRFSPSEMLLTIREELPNAIHELGHALQRGVMPAGVQADAPGPRRVLGALEATFYRRRATAGVGEAYELRSLREAAPGSGYSSREKTVSDAFADPYTGRWYGPGGREQGEIPRDSEGLPFPRAGTYEVLTMGLELLLRPDRWETDPDLIEFILGLVAAV